MLGVLALGLGGLLSACGGGNGAEGTQQATASGISAAAEQTGFELIAAVPGAASNARARIEVSRNHA